jgi:hypothetical protein
VKKNIYKYKGNILIKILINKYKKQYNFLIDNGDNGSCKLYPSFWKKNMKLLSQSNMQKNKEYRKLNKEETSQSFSDIRKHDKVILIRKITISEFALGGVPCTISNARFHGEGVAGSLGMGIFKFFKIIIIDDPAHKMYIGAPPST